MNIINIKIQVKCWKDPSTKAWIIYSSLFDISGYGMTKIKARRMFETQIVEIIKMSKPKKT